MSWTLGNITFDDDELAASLSIQRPSLIELYRGSDNRDYSLVKYQGETTRHWGHATIECNFEGLDAVALQKLRYLASVAGRFQVELDLAQFDGPVRCAADDLTNYYTPDAPLKSGSVTVYKNGVEQTTGFTLTVSEGKIAFAVALLSTDVVTAEYIWTPYVVMQEPDFSQEGELFELGNISLSLREVV